MRNHNLSKLVSHSSIASSLLDVADSLHVSPNEILDDALLKQVDYYASLLNHRVTVEFFHATRVLGLDSPKYINFRFNPQNESAPRFSLGYNYQTRLWSLKDSEKLVDSGFVLFSPESKYARSPSSFLSYIFQCGALFHSALIGG